MLVFLSWSQFGGSFLDFAVNLFVSFPCAVVAHDVARV